MVERYGIQDHDKGVQSTRFQNPTNQGTITNIGGGGDDAAYAPRSSPRAWIGDGHTEYTPTEKSLVKTILLALVFGPFGLAYTTLRGAAVVFGLMILAGIVRGGFDGLGNDAVMIPIWRVAVVASVVWTIIARRTHNEGVAKWREEKAAKDLEKK
jgi:hypothetical protein